MSVLAYVVLAQLSANSGVAFRDIVLGILGTFTLVVLAARGLGAFADERYGKMVTLILAAVPVVGFCYFPDQTLAILKDMFTLAAG